MSIPRDTAGNPLDPAFNSVAFTGNSPLTVRSIFTDHGPIARPPLTVFSGVNATMNGPDTITLPGANLNGTHVGLRLTISGSAANAGTFRIKSTLSATKARVAANFHLPDGSNGSLTWTIFDPRDGQIADDPSEVAVTINGTPVVPEAVVGLLGQIVLPTEPQPGDDVKVNYQWVRNPTVEIRRLNSREFRLNGWNRDVGHASRSKHVYRANNVLVKPSDYVSNNVLATLAQPLQRDLKYRAYERAYTAVLNDPNLLKLNTPMHRIAYPPLSRTVESSFVSYTATALPENDPFPWNRRGNGTASIQGGNTLVVEDTSTGPYPTGEPIYWSRLIDLTFPHVFAATWRMSITSVTSPQGVFTGVAAGYSDESRAIIVGYLDDGGVKKLGFLKAGSGNDPSELSSWIGGASTPGPVVFDWSVPHGFRIARDRDGNVRLFIDGSVAEIIRATESELPFLEELDTPFESLEGVFFGSVSRPARNTSNWEFFRYNILPLNPLQAEPSVFVSYEGTTTPETASQPWTPVGYAGTETPIGGFLFLDSTSATDPQNVLVGGDFKGAIRLEPLLSISSDVVLDFDVQLRTHTHGIAPNAIMAAIDDGRRLSQLSFLVDKAAPKLSYGGHSLPDVFTPTTWSTLGAQPVEMVGHYLRISDASTVDGRLYYINDNEPLASDSRVVSSTTDYILESRVRVLSYTPDAQGFAGASADVYDGLRAIGLLLREVAGVRYVSLQSDGAIIAQFQFEWNDNNYHTYRLVKSTGGNLVSVFVDTTLLGTSPYSSFAAPGAGTVGVVAFGSSTAASVAAQSVMEWAYTNAWRVQPNLKRYVGLWRGVDSDSLIGYHLPLKTRGTNAGISGSTCTDALVDFIAAGVAIGDYFIVDVGTNKGVYTIATVSTHTLTVTSPFPAGPSTVSYRIPTETDWTASHRYRIVRDPGGSVSVLLDMLSTPIINVGYNEIDLPQSSIGIPRILSGSLPSISFGAFDPTNLSQSVWDYVRYGITRTPTEQRIVPHHQVLNQRNVIASPEHLFATTAHSHTDYWSSSTGIPPQIEPDFLRDPSLVAYTLLNEGTPLVPQTQSFEVRNPQVVSQSVSGLNRPEDVLNSDRDFVLNNGEMRLSLVVPDDVLYNSLQVIETSVGAPNLLRPFDDNLGPDIGTFYFRDKHCLVYDGSVLPESDVSAATPWVRESEDPSHASASAISGVLTYGTDATGTKTIYRNATPLPDSPSFTTEVKFRIKLLSDSTGGTGDSQVRFGFSSPGLTLALAFVTTSIGERYILAIDQNTQAILGGQTFNFLDGNFHDYRLVRDPGAGTISIFIDS